VVVIADGVLNNLNFETLLVPGSKPHFWIEDVAVTNASSLRLLAAAHSPRESRAESLLLIGNPVSPGFDYPELSNASREMQNIERRFPHQKQQVYARDQATAQAYAKSKPEQYVYIHFVTHGTASHLSPLDSAIILSKAGNQEDSFKLYARDIIRHHLHANLVTISACFGSGTRAYTGEGLVGLSWAFLRAGAHNVIGALWEVSDDSTPLLMDHLYAELMKGRAPDAALRAAKLSLLHRQDVFRKPYYWAPFQLYAGS
jgi:CHAT domain-containing protein